MKTTIGMPRWMFWTLLLAVLFSIFGPLGAKWAKGSETLNRIYLVYITGHDEALTSQRFETTKHWKVTCTASKIGPEMDVRVYADPEAGGNNLEIIHLTGEGQKSCYVRDAGTYRIQVNGFDAAWKVTVENGD